MPAQLPICYAPCNFTWIVPHSQALSHTARGTRRSSNGFSGQRDVRALLIDVLNVFLAAVAAVGVE